MSLVLLQCTIAPLMMQCNIEVDATQIGNTTGAPGGASREAKPPSYNDVATPWEARKMLASHKPTSR